MRSIAVLLALGLALAACDSSTSSKTPAKCRFDVQADSAGEPSVRVFAVGFKQDVAAMRSYDDYRRIIFKAVEQEAPCFSKTIPNLVVLPENSALMAAFIGSRGEKAREKEDTVGAFAEFFQSYKGPIAYYREQFPDAPAIRRLLIAMTDTLGRAIETTYPVLAKKYGVYLAVSVDVGEYKVTDDAKIIAEVGDPDVKGVGPHYVATSDKVYNVSIVYGPDGKELGRVRKAYLVPDERDLLQLSAGSLEQLRPIETPFGRLAPVTSKDGWMPDVLERFNDLGADITLQHEAFSGWAIEEHEGDWLPEVMMESIWSHVQAYDSLRYGVLPCITGNLLDLVFDCQSTITKEAAESDTDQAFIGMDAIKGFLDIGPWAIDSTDRDTLRARGDAMKPGAGDPLENSYVASTARGDLFLPGVKEQLRARAPAFSAPALQGSATLPGFTKATLVSGDGMAENAIRPDIASSAGIHHIVWLRDKDGQRSAWYANVTAGTISTPKELPLVSRSPYSLRVAAAGLSVYAIAVQDIGTGGETSRLPFVRSNDAGKSWYPVPATFTEKGNWARWNPAIAAAGDHVYVTWVDRRSGASDIYLAASHDKGGTWTTRRLDEPNADEEIAADPEDVRNNQALPSIAVAPSGVTLAVSWSDFRNYAWDIFATTSTDGATTFSANNRQNKPRTATAGDEERERILSSSTIVLGNDGSLFFTIASGIDTREAFHSVRLLIEPTATIENCFPTGEQSITIPNQSYRPQFAQNAKSAILVWQAGSPKGNDIQGLAFDSANSLGPELVAAPGEQFNPRTAGGAVVWEDWRSGHGQIGFTELQ